MTYRVITATLTARTALHIGSGKGNDLTDALIRRDAEGQPFIPGTAIAGALRALLTRLAPRLGFEPCVALTGEQRSCHCAVCHLFGDLHPSDEEGSSSEVSRLLVFNARPKTVSQTLIRDGVGIDRVTGAAARAGAVKFDLEVVPAGSTFALRMELLDPTDEDERLLAAGLAEWQAGRMWLGGRVARGLGAFELRDLEYKTFPLNEADQLLAFLKDDEPWKRATPQTDWLNKRLADIHVVSVENVPTHVRPWVARGWVRITGILQAEGPLLTNDALISGATGFDHAPLLSRWGDWQHPVLTGAGIRGVLRSQAERIARTIATCTVENGDEFLTKCPACSPVERNHDAPLASCDALLKEAKVPTDTMVNDTQLCLACRLFGSTRRGSRLLVEDAPFVGERVVFKMLDFLAIDRFTGGGAEGLKFDALALWKPAFRLHIYLENPAEWELGWLALVLRDLAEGWLRVGLGAAKGFGQVRLKEWKAIFGYLTPDDLPSGLNLPDQPGKSGVYSTLEITGDKPKWREVAQKWVDAFHTKLREFSRPEDLRLKKDSYFGRVDHLYPAVLKEAFNE